MGRARPGIVIVSRCLSNSIRDLDGRPGFRCSCSSSDEEESGSDRFDVEESVSLSLPNKSSLGGEERTFDDFFLGIS